ncbi:MAG: leucine-rich repeat protein, partial [Tidjanibacter sp.]|nr:leucine-rich repeat protein [Tidjanibacter sp.]
EDGITPKLEIRDGYWYISYDNGQSWVELGKATGEDGKDGADGADGEDGKDGENGKDGADGDSLFESVTWDDEYAYFTLSDGTVIKIPLALDSEAEEGDLPPANEIWYTSTDGEVVTPYWEIDEEGNSVFNANIISNTYKNGKGVITFDSDVTSIGYGAFAGSESLASVTIPDSVTSIGGSAFWNCTSLTSITIPDRVTSIGREAFYGCTSLTSVYCEATTPPAGGSYMFYNNASGRKIYVPTESVDAYKTAEYWSKYADAFVPYDFEKGEVDMKYRKICYTSTDGNAVTPYATNVFGANIVSNTYEDGKGVIVFDSVVTSIGENAFYDCSSLASITIPDSVTSIGDFAFAVCESLASVTIPESVTSIGLSAFNSCSSLVSVTIPESVTSIGEGAFYGCKSLTSITIPDGVTSIGAQAFSWCTSLTSVTIGDGVTSIGIHAFSACSSLASVSIGNGVTSIEHEAFGGCSSLASVTIPDSVTSIGDWAFSYCSSLTSVYCKATTPPAGGSSMFYNNASGRKIYVPTESVEAYKTAEYWSDYADYIVGYDFGGDSSDTNGVKEVAAVSLGGMWDMWQEEAIIPICGFISDKPFNGDFLSIDSWSYGFTIISDTEPINDEIPLGTYTYVDYEKIVNGEEELKAGTFVMDQLIDDDITTQCYYTNANGETQGFNYTEGVMVVSEGKIELTVTLENGEVHHVVYEGSLQTWGQGA